MKKLKMKYNLADPKELEKAADYLSKLSSKECIAEIKEVRKNRSLRQNAYLHLTFGIFGLELGYDTAEAKMIYKRYACPELYVYKKNGIPFVKSSADLDVKQMTDSIEKWRKYAAEAGVDIPAPNNQEALMYYQNRIEQEGGKWL